MREFDVAVIGGGLAGSIAALAFSRAGFSTALVAPSPVSMDRRTTALMQDSIDFIDGLGLWEETKNFAAPLKVMRILDGTKRLLRAPPVSFRASEIGLFAFGYNIPNAPFLDLLKDRLDTEEKLTRIAASVKDAAIGETALLTLNDGEKIKASLLIGADGQQSIVRASLGIGVRTTQYPQTAVVLNFRHEYPHQDMSTEFHTETGPCTQVPLGPNRSSLVWVVRPEQAADLVDMTEEALNRRIEERLQSVFGKVNIEERPQSWPLSAMTANAFGEKCALLVGEAAHRFPPIGAQGLNLSLRDIKSAVELALKARNEGSYAGIGERYDRARKADVWTRTGGIHLLNRSLLSNFLPVQMLRAAGLHIMDSLPPVRHFFMQEGVAPGRGLRGFPDFLREKIGRKRA